MVDASTQRLAIIDGLRTPFVKAGGLAAGLGADDLGALVARELMARSSITGRDLDEVIVGNVAQPADAANIARIIALKAGLPQDLIASTVHRNCASGMEAISGAGMRIRSGEGKILLCVGAESMSNIPLLFNRQMTALFVRLMKAKTLTQKLSAWMTFRPAFLNPIIGVQVGLTDPVAGVNMGQTAEILAREFHITRDAQDAFALESHCKTIAAAGRLQEELMALPLPPKYTAMLTADDGPRANLDLAGLTKLKPYFDKVAGTVTVGNACPITDGAAAVIVMGEAQAREMGLKPLGYVRDWAYAALDGKRMGLGPVYATSKLLKKTGMAMADFDTVELNEAFAAQVLACTTAFASQEFARTHLGRDTAVGEIDPAKLNVNGGAIALGHPVGATGARLVLTGLKELKRRGGGRCLATLCIGGGQGAAFALESE